MGLSVVCTKCNSEIEVRKPKLATEPTQSLGEELAIGQWWRSIRLVLALVILVGGFFGGFVYLMKPSEEVKPEAATKAKADESAERRREADRESIREDIRDGVRDGLNAGLTLLIGFHFFLVSAVAGWIAWDSSHMGCRPCLG